MAGATGANAVTSKLLYREPRDAIAAALMQADPHEYAAITAVRSYGSAAQVRRRITRGEIAGWIPFLDHIDVAVRADGHVPYAYRVYLRLNEDADLDQLQTMVGSEPPRLNPYLKKRKVR